jgi:hypothetical protein
MDHLTTLAKRGVRHSRLTHTHTHTHTHASTHTHTHTHTDHLTTLAKRRVRTSRPRHPPCSHKKVYAPYICIQRV